MHFFFNNVGELWREILNFLQEVLETCCFKSSLDASLITLIPKKPGTQNIKSSAQLTWLAE